MSERNERYSERLAEELNDQAYRNRKEAELKEAQDLLERLRTIKKCLPEEKYVYCQYHLLGSIVDIEEALVTGAFFETNQEERVVIESMKRGKEVRRGIEEIYPSFSKKYAEDKSKRSPKDYYGFGLIRNLLGSVKEKQEEQEGQEGQEVGDE